MQMNITWLKIPTGWRQTGWLFTKREGELNLGLPRNNSSYKWSEGDWLETAISGFQVPRPNNSRHAANLILVMSNLFVDLVSCKYKKCILYG